MLACSLKIPLLFCRSRRAPRSHKNVQRTFLWDALLRHPPSLLILHAGTAPKERSSCHSTFLFPSPAQEQLRRSALPASLPSSSHLPRRNSSAGAHFLPLNLPLPILRAGTAPQERSSCHSTFHTRGGRETAP